ncbi:hypothetical protein F5Y07DRAFT_379375 [Xylaria sp. FL0933]|nr:hypothetical protein F5Y07DRAFT_379375 [Xylaria sp. FL0933]
MSPKVDSSKVSAVSAWSRDARPNASGVTYSRRSYYYDREFSDTIVRPASPDYLLGSDGLASNSDATHSVVRSGRQVESRVSSAGASRLSRRVEDPFTRGRVLQSASGGGDEESGIELQSRVPVAAADSESGLNIAGLDVQVIARGIVFAADVFVRVAEAYQRVRDDDQASESDVDTDPCHLEAGPPRRSRRASRALPKRDSRGRFTSSRHALASAATEIGASDETQGRSRSTHTSATRTLPAPPLSAAKRVCYYLIATAVFGIAASFAIAVWWAVSQGDASAGFTIGGYIIAVDALLVAIVGVVHRPGCRCWKA